MRRVVSPWRSLLLLALPAVLAGCEKIPKVFLVAGHPEVDPETTYNVLIVGSGFQTEADLVTYRRAALLLGEKLIAGPPFEENVQVYRIDLKGKAPSKSACAADCIHTPVTSSLSPGAPPPLRVFNPDGEDVLERDLRVKLCWHPGGGSASCKALWLDAKGEDRAFDLVPHGPNISCIVVIANTSMKVGAGRQNAYEGGIDLIVMGLPQAANGDPSDQAHGLFGHELGHALGLLDEYTGVLVGQPVKFRKQRNVWKPKPSVYPNDRWKPSLGDPPLGKWGIPWLADLADQPKLHKDCPADGDPPPCPVNAAVSCPFVPAGGDCGISAGTGLPLGIWEGAFYQEKGYYRSQGGCRMDEEDEFYFCAACMRHLIDEMALYGS